MVRPRPRVSIGLPVFNGETFLAEAIDSLLAQTYEDFELIVVDNASTDRTADICRAHAASDGRVRYIRNEINIGVNRNCSKAFQLSSGEYFKLAAADDVCHRELLARCVEVLDRDATVVLAYARTRFIDEKGAPLDWSDPGFPLLSHSPLERMRYVIASGHWVNVFYGLTRSKDLARTRLFPPYASGDYRLIGELSLRGRFFEIPEYLFFRRIHGSASSQNKGLQWQSEFFKGRRGRVELPFWHLCLDHGRSIVCSDLRVRHKISCIGMILQRMFAGKRTLFIEIQEAVKFLYGQTSQSYRL
jgi:glycosyltransferase involved in cell wall biosynthesis